MNNLIFSLKKHSALISTIAFITAAVINLLFGLFALPKAFFPMLGNIVSVILSTLLLISIPLLSALKKQALKKTVTPIALTYAAIVFLGALIAQADNVTAGQAALGIISSLLLFVAALGFLSAIVMIIIDKFGNKDLNTAILFSVLISLAVTALGFLLSFIWLIVDGAFWVTFFNVFECFICLPAALVFHMLPFIISDGKNYFSAKKATRTKSAKARSEKTKSKAADGSDGDKPNGKDATDKEQDKSDKTEEKQKPTKKGADESREEIELDPDAL